MLENQLANGPSEIKKFCNHISNALRSGVVDFAHFHVCCFSETVEDLAQWRAYADDGCGFAIGFDAPIMKKQFDSDITASDVQLFPVIYDDDRLSDLLSDLVTEYLSRMSVLLKMKVDLEIRSQFILQLGSTLGFCCVQISLCFKHPAYRHEKEYRFLKTYSYNEDKSIFQVRSRPYELVKFTEYPWKNVAADSLKEIVLGPASDEEKSSKFVRDCLRAYGLESISPSIIRSALPYRSM